MMQFQSMPDYVAAAVQSLDGNDNVSREDILALLVPDQEFLLIEIYRLKYGDIFDFGFTCGECGHDGPQSADLSKLDMLSPPVTDNPKDPTLTVTLQRSGWIAVVGMLTGKKESLILELMMNANPDVNQADFQALRSLNGKTDFTYHAVASLKPLDHKEIRRARKLLIAGYDTRITAKCPGCGARVTFNLLMHPNFLLPAG